MRRLLESPCQHGLLSCAICVVESCDDCGQENMFVKVGDRCGEEICLSCVDQFLRQWGN